MLMVSPGAIVSAHPASLANRVTAAARDSTTAFHNSSTAGKSARASDQPVTGRSPQFVSVTSTWYQSAPTSTSKPRSTTAPSGPPLAAGKAGAAAISGASTSSFAAIGVRQSSANRPPVSLEFGFHAQ